MVENGVSWYLFSINEHEDCAYTSTLDTCGGLSNFFEYRQADIYYEILQAEYEMSTGASRFKQ